MLVFFWGGVPSHPIILAVFFCVIYYFTVPSLFSSCLFPSDSTLLCLELNVDKSRNMFSFLHFSLSFIIQFYCVVILIVEFIILLFLFYSIIFKNTCHCFFRGGRVLYLDVMCKYDILQRCFIRRLHTRVLLLLPIFCVARLFAEVHHQQI